MEKLLIKNGRVIDPSQGLDSTLDILISNGRIESLKANISAPEAEVINASGLIVSPGLVDMHVHLRDPGQTQKEDVISGCKAAVAGGITSLLAMPNTNPAADSAEIVRYVQEKAIGAAAHVYIAGAITKGLRSEAATDFEALAAAGAIALTDDGAPVPNTPFLAQALKESVKLGLKVVSHCEDVPLAKGGLVNEGKVSQRLSLKGIPNAAEDADTARVIAIAAAYNVPVHICHVSTWGAVSIIRSAKAAGIKVTAETAPHYIALTEDIISKRDADYRMNPPLRTEADRQAIIAALKDGTIDAIATDHAPHTPSDKAEFETAPNGVIGMETSLAACLTALEGQLTTSEIIEKMSTAPAKILNINAGSLKEGSPADIAIFDPNESWTVNVDELHGKSKNCVFKGLELKGKVKFTLLAGEVVFGVDDARRV
ncbi:MAG: dihydroorotase [Oscillospiraceae bacterium]|nr:dihydroorotase [Oscillospiraceae bacterium]